MSTYYDVNSESIVLKQFIILDSKNNNANQQNIDYFVEHFNEIINLNLKESIKHLIYHAICNDEMGVLSNFAIKKDYAFSRLPFYLMLEKNEQQFFKMVDYFSENINQYCMKRINQSYHATQKDFKEIIKLEGLTKIKALVKAELFLPYQSREILKAVDRVGIVEEKEKIENKMNKVIIPPTSQKHKI